MNLWGLLSPSVYDHKAALVQNAARGKSPSPTVVLLSHFCVSNPAVRKCHRLAFICLVLALYDLANSYPDTSFQRSLQWKCPKTRTQLELSWRRHWDDDAFPNVGQSLGFLDRNGDGDRFPQSGVQLGSWSLKSEMGCDNKTSRGDCFHLSSCFANPCSVVCVQDMKWIWDPTGNCYWITPAALERSNKISMLRWHMFLSPPTWQVKGSHWRAEYLDIWLIDIRRDTMTGFHLGEPFFKTALWDKQRESDLTPYSFDLFLTTLQQFFFTRKLLNNLSSSSSSSCSLASSRTRPAKIEWIRCDRRLFYLQYHFWGEWFSNKKYRFERVR